MTDKLKEEELLMCFINGWIPDKELTKDGKECKRKIVALIQKPEVTEEWMNNKIAEINDVWAGEITAEDFIRSILRRGK